MYFEYRIVKIEKGLFLIEYRSTPDGTWQDVKDKQFKSRLRAEKHIKKHFLVEDKQ